MFVIKVKGNIISVQETEAQEKPGIRGTGDGS